MPKKKKLNINRIKNYYIRHDISLRKLAEKYKVSTATIQRYKKDGNWDEEKAKYRAEVEEKTLEKLKEADTKALVEAERLIPGIIGNAVSVLSNMSQDQQQFYRQTTSPNERMDGHYEYISQKADTKSFLNYVKAITELSAVLKNYSEEDKGNNITVAFDDFSEGYAE